MKFMVVGWPSLRQGKLRLYGVTMVFGAWDASPARRHWPMQGPQALASTVASISLSDCICPSRAMVARTCSDPGVTSSGTAALMPCARAWLATSAARLMSSSGRIGAAADQRGGDVVDKRVARVSDFGGEHRDRARPVRRMRPDHIGFELRGDRVR